MPVRDERGRTAGKFGNVALAVTSLTASAGILVALWNGGTLNPLICGGDCGADAAAVPEALALRPGGTAAEAGALPDITATPSSRLDPAAVRAAVTSALTDDKLGERVGFAAVDPRTGAVLATQGSGTFAPASTAKILTAVTVLSILDPQQRFVTSVVQRGDQLVLVGGGDPYLVSKPYRPRHPAVRADLATLAKRTAAALRHEPSASIRLGYDDSLFSGPALSPAWEESYVTERVVSPISALWADQVLGIHADEPSKAAAEKFAEFLGRRGVDVTLSGPTAAPVGATRIAEVKSATVAQATEQMIAASDNDAAEVLLRQAAIGARRPGTFTDGLAVEAEVLRQRGIAAPGLVIHDGSGLSRHDRLAPITLALAIAKASADPRTAGLIADLPVAHFSGSLEERFGHLDTGQGLVRAKTGTLSGVHSLAGYANDRNGVPIAFAVMVDKTKDISSLDTETALDRVAAALAGCMCSAASPGVA